MMIGLTMMALGQESGSRTPAPSSDGFAPSGRSSAKAFDVTKTIVLGEQQASIARSDVGLGSFPPGSVLNCSLLIQNAGNRSLRFDRLELGCNCLSVTPRSGEVPVGGQLLLNARIKTAKNPTRVQHSAIFTGFDARVPSFSIRLEYGLSGIVGFSSQEAQILIPRGCESYATHLKFFADELSVPDLIEVYLSPELASVDGLDVKLSRESQRVDLTIAESVVSEQNRFGELHIKNIETGFTGSILLSFGVESAVSVFPSTLRFRSPETGMEHEKQKQRVSTTKGDLIAYLMVLDKNALKSDAAPPVVELSFGGRRLTSNVLRQTGQLTHISIRMPRNLMVDGKEDGSEKKLHCRVIGSKSDQVFSLKISEDSLRGL